MDHLKQYEIIINKAIIEKRKKYSKNNIRYIYYERHHILPKCLGGTNNAENLVLLTAKEHYVCHKLLTYIYKGNKKLANAFCRMTWDKNGRRNITSKDYAYAKELKALIPFSLETLEKMRKPHGPMNEKHKLNISNSQKGKSKIGGKHSVEASKKQSERQKGKPTWNKGKKISEETKQKISKTGKGKSRNKGRKLSEEQKEYLRIINTGKKQSKETIEKRMKTMISPWNKGLKTGPLSDNHKEKIRQSNLGKHGWRENR